MLKWIIRITYFVSPARSWATLVGGSYRLIVMIIIILINVNYL